MSKRLAILQASLEKKQNAFDEKLENHFSTVKQANGQPLNDKRAGQATLNKWSKQNDSLTTLDSSITKTKEAIERELFKISVVNSVELPDCIKKLIDDGTLTQWRKHPNYFFVNGVEKGRIILDSGKILQKYYLSIPTIEQKEKFKEIFYKLKNEVEKI